MLRNDLREALNVPFDKKFVKQRQGNGRTLDYIEGDKIITRLNEVFKHRWNFEVLTPPNECIIDDFMIVNVRLTVPVYDDDTNVVKGYIVKEHAGGKQVGRKRVFIKKDVVDGKEVLTKTGGEIMDLASDYKAATTDGLKKAATLLGIALDLYGSDEKETVVAKEKEEVLVDGPATSVQLNGINRLATSKKVPNLDAFIKELIGASYSKLDSLKESEARRVITSLNSYESK